MRLYYKQPARRVQTAVRYGILRRFGKLGNAVAVGIGNVYFKTVALAALYGYCWVHHAHIRKRRGSGRGGEICFNLHLGAGNLHTIGHIVCRNGKVAEPVGIQHFAQCGTRIAKPRNTVSKITLGINPLSQHKVILIYIRTARPTVWGKPNIQPAIIFYF